MTCGQATVLHLLNGSIEKTRLLASAFRNNQDQAMANDNTISQACTGIWLQQLGPRVNIIVLS
jgi:hypothetical protein